MNTKQTPLQFTYGLYENMSGYWCEVKDEIEEYVVSGGHFKTKNDVFRYYLQSKKYFGSRMKGKVEIL